MKDAPRASAAGESLAPELDALLERVVDVKQRLPKEDLGLL